MWKLVLTLNSEPKETIVKTSLSRTALSRMNAFKLPATKRVGTFASSILSRLQELT